MTNLETITAKILTDAKGGARELADAGVITVTTSAEAKEATLTIARVLVSSHQQFRTALWEQVLAAVTADAA